MQEGNSNQQGLISKTELELRWLNGPALIGRGKLKYERALFELRIDLMRLSQSSENLSCDQARLSSRVNIHIAFLRLSTESSIRQGCPRLIRHLTVSDAGNSTGFVRLLLKYH